MRIAVLGATGGTGKVFIKQALARGHEVTALARSSQRLAFDDPRLTVIVGDALNVEDAARTVTGQDAIYIALGSGKSRKKTNIRADGTRHVVNTLVASGENPHVVVQSSLGVGDSRKQLRFHARWMVSLVLRHPFADHRQQEKIIRASSLRWTILRPTVLNDGSATGDVSVSVAPKRVKVKPSIARADIATFALSTIETKDYRHRAVTVTPCPEQSGDRGRERVPAGSQ